MAFGDAEAADGRRAHAALTYATFSCRNPLPCDFPALRRPRHSNPFPPLTQVKLWTPPAPSLSALALALREASEAICFDMIIRMAP